MKLSLLFLIVAALLFLLSTVPKLSRSWMIGIGLVHGLFLVVAALLFLLSTVPKLSRPWSAGSGSPWHPTRLPSPR
jgi:hypothetical protein